MKTKSVGPSLRSPSAGRGSSAAKGKAAQPADREGDRFTPAKVKASTSKPPPKPPPGPKGPSGGFTVEIDGITVGGMPK